MTEPKTVYQCDADGYYAGEAVCYGGLMPHGCVALAPPVIAGRIPRWNGRSWDQAENHVGEKGYVNGKPFAINNYGPRPEGWSFDPPEPSNEVKAARLQARITAAEAGGERPAREINLALAEGRTPPPQAVARLKAVEQEIAKLREELSHVAAGA